MAIQSIFISRNPQEIRELVALCAKCNVHLTAQSLITFRALSFEIPEIYDVIFFSSTRAIDFFLQKSSISSTCEIACIGINTAKSLQEKGYPVSFVGEQAGRPESVAEDFKIWLGTRSVLLPISAQSKRTIAEAIPASQYMEILTYETIAKPASVGLHDLYVFSSPSNYSSFVAENPTPQHGVIAWGETTRKEILKNGVQPTYTLETASEKELIDWLLHEGLLF